MTKPTIAMIGLNKLTRSPLNVRKTAASEEADNELYASIKADGIKQNLLVHKSGNGYHVHAGGRRLAVLERLAAEGHISADVEIPCIVETKKQAEETSLIENFVRAGMHPADEFEAFDALEKKGWSREEIANRFGVTLNFVDRRMKLARVSPVIIEAFRADKMTLEAVQAFSITDDHGRQNEVWEELSSRSYGFYTQNIKAALTQRTYHGSSKLARFVGIDAYQTAGGAILRDLFSDNDSVHFCDSGLLEKLALEKLQTKVDELANEWKWADAQLEVAYDTLRPFGRVYPEPVEPDPAQVAEFEQLEARLEALSNQYDEETWTEELQAEEDAAAARVEELRLLFANDQVFTAEQKAIAGVIVTLDHSGQFRIEAGLVRPEDLPKKVPSTDGDESPANDGPVIRLPVSSSTIRSDDPNPAAEARKEQGISASLADDLRATRHQILKAHLAADFATAFDVMLYSMCTRVLGENGYKTTPIDVSIKHAETYQSREAIVDTVAARMLQATRDGLNVEWRSLTSPQDFEAMCSLPESDKQALFAWCVGHGVIQQLATDNKPNPVVEAIGHRMAVDTGACWRPTAENYWSRTKKDHAIKLARDLIGNRWADDKAKDKKPVIAAAMEQAFSEDPRASAGLTPETAAKTSVWLPDGMAFSGVITEQAADADFSYDEEGPDGDDDETVDVSEGATDQDAALQEADQEIDEDDIPAFLKDNAA
ncbi:ParB N-terminal domain-containing protein (plasmid) [Agrobacterium leguminum]|uniref:ParB/RepB/Spo0J family partition protein n=1 Tax=Agrobacterium leguminum TaxID=2792015 RepID=UPI0010C9AF68|nr:ParB/RepB/Spo0J family partition protein [Agrobacterium leguminum]WFS69530.1 ParB N-terminal domain-containing protein [Agrobacterium leguminum]